MALDLTKGPPLSLTIRFALPMLAGGIFQQFYNIVDMLIVGKANGAADLAAIGATSSAMFFILSLVLGLTVAYSIIAAQHFGANNFRMVRRTMVGAAYITLATYALLAAAGLWGTRPLLRILHTPPDIIDNAATYMRICLTASLGMLVYNGASAILRGVGDSRTPLYFLMLSSVLNVVLDLFFVLGLEWGVRGVAVATVISQTVSALVCVVYMFWRFPMFRVDRKDLRPRWPVIRSIARIGVSMGMQTLLLSIGDMIIASRVNSYGTDVVAAYAAGARVSQIATLVYFILTEAFAVFAGQNLGARQTGRVKEGFTAVLLLTMALSVVSTILIHLFGRQLVGWFIADTDPRMTEVVGIAYGFLRITSLFYPFLGLIWLYNNTLRGMGETVMPLLSGLLELVTKIALSFWLGAALGYVGIWYAGPIGWIIGTAPSLWRFHTGDWEKMAGHITPPESVRLISERFIK